MVICCRWWINIIISVSVCVCVCVIRGLVVLVVVYGYFLWVVVYFVVSSWVDGFVVVVLGVGVFEG